MLQYDMDSTLDIFETATNLLFYFFNVLFKFGLTKNSMLLNKNAN